MTPATDPPDDLAPGWERWWQDLRQQRKQWAHGPKSADPFELIWSSAEASGFELDWASLSAAFSVFGLADLDRPAHVRALARQLASAHQAARVLDPFATAPTFIAQVADAPTAREAVAITPNRAFAQRLGSTTGSCPVRWVPAEPQDVLPEPEDPALDAAPFDFITASPPLALPQSDALPGDLPLVLGGVPHHRRVARTVVRRRHRPRRYRHDGRGAASMTTLTSTRPAEPPQRRTGPDPR